MTVALALSAAEYGAGRLVGTRDVIFPQALVLEHVDAMRTVQLLCKPEARRSVQRGFDIRLTKLRTMGAKRNRSLRCM